jgi:hypothetical protein
MRVRFAGLGAVLVLGITGVAACSTGYVTPPPPTQRPETEVPILATPWANGTIGKYGLHINPGLIANIPAVVGGNPLVEDTSLEIAAMDDAQYADAFSGYYVAHLNQVTDLNWLEVSVGERKADALDQDFYTSWRDSWFKTACSQADGIKSSGTEQINDWTVDVATCTGGVNAYTLALDNGDLVSIMDLGPRRLGRQLIAGIN